MRPLSINLASRPFYNTTLYAVAYAVSVGFLVVTTVLNLYMFTSNQIAQGDIKEARASLQAEMSSLDRREVGLERDLRRINFSVLKTQSEFAGDVILQRVFSWTLLFNRLEQLLPPDVKLRSIRPSVETDQIVIRVVGLAKNADSVVDFEENLIKSPRFADVYPRSETASPALRGIVFDLSFVYLPPVEVPGGDTTADAAVTPAEEVAARIVGDKPRGGAAGGQP